MKEKKLEYSLFSVLCISGLVLLIGVLLWVFGSEEAIQANIDGSTGRRKARSDLVGIFITPKATSVGARIFSILMVFLALWFLFGFYRTRFILRLSEKSVSILNLQASLLFKPQQVRVYTESITFTREGNCCVISAESFEGQAQETVKVTVMIFLIRGRERAIQQFIESSSP